MTNRLQSRLAAVACLAVSGAVFLSPAALGQNNPPSVALAKEMLAAHNAVRAKAGVPPLTWSDDLAKYAQEWANTLLARDRFAHRPKNPYGENLFEIRGAPASPRQVVESWASEARDYDYSANRCRGTCGHYTQIVWRSTKEAGCAIARDQRHEIWVCDYNPPGNIVGQKPY